MPVATRSAPTLMAGTSPVRGPWLMKAGNVKQCTRSTHGAEPGSLSRNSQIVAEERIVGLVVDVAIAGLEAVAPEKDVRGQRGKLGPAAPIDGEAGAQDQVVEGETAAAGIEENAADPRSAPRWASSAR